LSGIYNNQYIERESYMLSLLYSPTALAQLHESNRGVTFKCDA